LQLICLFLGEAIAQLQIPTLKEEINLLLRERVLLFCCIRHSELSNQSKSSSEPIGNHSTTEQTFNYKSNSNQAFQHQVSQTTALRPYLPGGRS
jgi:hypothetical protein